MPLFFFSFTKTFNDYVPLLDLTVQNGVCRYSSCNERDGSRPFEKKASLAGTVQLSVFKKMFADNSFRVSN